MIVDAACLKEKIKYKYVKSSIRMHFSEIEKDNSIISLVN